MEINGHKLLYKQTSKRNFPMKIQKHEFMGPLETNLRI